MSVRFLKSRRGLLIRMWRKELVSSGAIAFVGASRIHRGIVDTLKSEGRDVYAHHAKGTNFSPGPNAFFVEDLASLALVDSISSVFYCNEEHYQAACLLAADLDLQAPRYTPVAIDKGLQGRLVGQHSAQLRVPSGSTPEQIDHQLLLYQQPVIAKPLVETGGSKNVFLIDRYGPAEIYRHQRKQLAVCVKHSDYLIEPWVSGSLYCVDGYIREGTPHFLTAGEYVKHPRNEVLISAIALQRFELAAISHDAEATLRAWLGQLGLNDGPFHMEFIAGPEKYHLVEIHGRFGGSILPEAIYLATGTNPFSWAPEQGEPQRRDTPVAGSLVLFCYPSDTTETSAAEIEYRSPQASGYRIHQRRAASGTPQNASDRIAYIASQSSSSLDGLRQLDAIVERLQLRDIIDSNDHEIVLQRLKDIYKEW